MNMFEVLPPPPPEPLLAATDPGAKRGEVGVSLQAFAMQSARASEPSDANLFILRKPGWVNEIATEDSDVSRYGLANA
jgi:hypothetical protein